MRTSIQEKAVGAVGSISGAASIMGSWQVCHSLCLGLIALLGILGIAVTGMPLVFFTKIAIPLWAIAVILLVVAILIYSQKKCISKNLILFNSGLIIAGTPFQQVQKFSLFFWIIGGLIALSGIFLFVGEKIKGRKCKHEK